jgi:hypothetical protein
MLSIHLTTELHPWPNKATLLDKTTCRKLGKEKPKVINKEMAGARHSVSLL